MDNVIEERGGVTVFDYFTPSLVDALAARGYDLRVGTEEKKYGYAGTEGNESK